MGKLCVFFDRDGIVNRSPGPGYVERLEDFHILPEFIECLRVVLRRGYEAVIVTNQRGVALGRVSAETVQSMHDHLEHELAREGLNVLDIMVCPHDNDECTCRKPNPGMFLEAARRHDIDLTRSWAVGDNERDVEAGCRAGCRTVLVGRVGERSVADHRVARLEDLAAFLREHLEGGPVQV